MFNKIILVSAVAVTFAMTVPSAAQAQERRLGDTAMGAAAGFLVGGPIGMVAGGVIGYHEGERIAHGLGFHHQRRYTQSPARDRSN